MVATGGSGPPDFSAVDYAKAVSEKCAALSIKYLGDAESIINCIMADDAGQLAHTTSRADGKERGLMLLLASIHGAFYCVIHLQGGLAIEYVDMGLGDGIPGCSSLVELAAQFGHHQLISFLENVGGGTAFDVPSALFEAAYQHPNGQLKCLLGDEGTRKSINTANSKGLIPLMMASASAVPLLVEAGADVNLMHGRTGTALHHACHFASLQKVKALVECGADENRAGPGGKTPLMVAVYQTQADIVEYLLGRPGIDIEAKAADEDRAIHFACYRRHVGMVKLLVGAGAKVNVQPTDKGSPPLVVAASGGDLQVVKYLVESGADVGYTSRFGNMPLMLAAKGGHVGIVEYLLGRPGVNIEAKNEDGERAIDMACGNNHLDVVKMLIAAGAKIEDKYQAGALAAAARWGSLQVVKYLVEEAGANENHAGNEGWTPLMAAADGCRADVMEYLLGRPGININAKNEQAETAIDIACRNDHVDVVKLLVAAGANVDPRQDTGEPRGVFPSAILGGSLRVVKYLVEEAGLDANRAGRDGVTPLTWARRLARFDIVNYLKTVVSQPDDQALRVAEAAALKAAEEMATAAFEAAEERAAAAAAALLEEEDKEAAAKETGTKKRKKKKGQKRGGAAAQEQGPTSTLEPSEIPDDTQTLIDSLASTTIAGEGFGGPREETSTGRGSVVGGADPEKPCGQQHGGAAGGPSPPVDCKAKSAEMAESSAEAGLEQVMEGLSCPITFQLMTDPMMADDGHTYQQHAIEEWINKCITDQRPVTSPLTGAAMGTSLKPNLLVRSMVRNLVRSSTLGT